MVDMIYNIKVEVEIKNKIRQKYLIYNIFVFGKRDEQKLLELL